MSLRVTTDINVDFYDKKYILINAKQNDRNSRFLSITCYNHGEPYPINSSEHSVYVRYKKSDNNGVFNFCEIDRKGKILVELTEQMLVSDGICYADLVIVNKGHADVDADTGEIIHIDNSSILSTMTFCIDVSEMAVANSEIESTYEFNLLNTKLEEYWADFEDVMKTSKSWAVGNSGLESRKDIEDTDNAKYYYEQAFNSANNASESEINALNSATAAATSEANALDSANKAAISEANALVSANSASMNASTAINRASAANEFASIAQSSMKSASDSALLASESETNAHNYYLQAESVVNGLNGAFLPKGTITFAELLELKENGTVADGYLYHISDDFTTDENFRISGKVCGAGTSVYYTVDNQFDVFVGTTVAGVKGKNETEYRTGMVNITPENVGAIPSADIVTVDEMKNYLGID